MPPEKPWPFETADHVDPIARHEAVDRDRLADLEPLDPGAEFADALLRLDACRLIIARHSAGDPALFHLAESQGNGLVAVRFLGLPLYDGTRPGRDHGNRDRLSVVGEYAGHPDLAADDVFHG